MKKTISSSVFLKILLTLAVFLTVTSLAFAREDYFAPLMADITLNSSGSERFSVGEDGQINGFSYAGQLLPGFPINIDDMVAVSSPVAANLRGDAWPELVFVTRNSADEYFLNAYSATGQLIATVNVGGEVAYDPAVFHANNTDEVFVAASSGDIFSFHLENDLFVSKSIARLGGPAGLLITANRKLIVNFPSLNKAEVYTENNGAWTLTETINLQNPVIYPFSYDNATAFYGVTRNNQLLAIDGANWQIKAGFPAELNGVPVGSALVAEVNSANPEYEISVSLSNAETLVFRTNGGLLEKTGAKRFAETGLGTADTLAGAKYSAGLRSLTGRIENNSLRRIISYLSRIKAPFINVTADINIKANNINVPSGGNFDLGSAILDSNKDFGFTVENLGSDVLVLNGNQFVEITGPDAAEFQITQQPGQVLMPGSNSQIGMRFFANSAGVKTATITISSNDPDETIYTINISASVTPGVVYEDAENGNTAGWSLYYPQWQFGTITNIADEDAAHGRAIQLTQTLNGAAYYRLRKDDQTEWNNTTERILKWDMKTTNETVVYVYITTNKGLRRTVYSFNRDPNKFTGIDSEFNLNSSFKDGAWHTISRNLEQDLKKLDNTLTITKVNYMMIGALPVGQNARFDNIILSSDAGRLHTISGTVLDAAGQPVPGFRLGLMPDSIAQKTDAAGKFYFASLPSGAYSIQSQSGQFELDPKIKEVVVADANISDLTLSAQLQDNIVYEDGEDGTINGWGLYYPTWQYGTITNVADEDPVHGRAIQLTQTINSATYYRLMNEKGLDWDNDTSKILKWDMKTDSETVIYVYTTTNKGLRRAIYSFNRDPNKYTGQDAEFNLNPTFKDGAWHTISRNLEQDLKKYDSELVLTKVNYMMVGSFAVGKGARFDNIIATKNVGALHAASGTFVDAQGAPVANIKATLLPEQISVTSKADGKFAFTSLPDGNYSIRIDTPHYSVSAGADITISGADRTDLNVVTPFSNALVYEDAEDGLTLGWKLNYPQWQNGTITNVPDEDATHGKAIEILQTISGSQYFKFASDSGADWNNPFGKILQWDMKTGNEMLVYAYLSTNKGQKRAIYSYTRAASYNGTDAYFNIGADLKDGAWHNFAKDLDADMKTVDPTINVTGLKFLLLTSAGLNKPARIDNIRVLVNPEPTQ